MSNNMVTYIIKIVNQPMCFCFLFIGNINFLVKIIIVIFKSINFHLDVYSVKIQMLQQKTGRYIPISSESFTG